MFADNSVDHPTSRSHVPEYRTLDPEDHQNALIDQLFEGSREFRDATPENRHEELADVLEVVRALTTHLGLTDATLSAVAADRRSQRGGFEQLIWLG